jgi:hypothetical protein
MSTTRAGTGLAASQQRLSSDSAASRSRTGIKGQCFIIVGLSILIIVLLIIVLLVIAFS